ncbi:uncharacterized protein MONOS_14072 [Monocercomonoides exilis]|uniref:uncharacterized protein n=1 Tax=Monocercomonoides exilis TaxID=2049356 RepID=UPI00355A5ADC|nr:hypothetical protein MONOS_14072 [Monocercomonoides exilis]|eukprot:MONOS_14072.1-p1 / transcript=MONOS_14072.1 / gene=MONOS_14072 / organism=Monocercomonoides_exilis_PA203 / gene_product=unspecified product / transcript_product=unspecified product / location=Mono_scaffold00931:16986-19487(+) / protein_length=785 / sequence_SO=supercontig / SO=protein_coding / is_pseudo=false
MSMEVEFSSSVANSITDEILDANENSMFSNDTENYIRTIEEKKIKDKHEQSNNFTENTFLTPPTQIRTLSDNFDENEFIRREEVCERMMSFMKEFLSPSQNTHHCSSSSNCTPTSSIPSIHKVSLHKKSSSKKFLSSDSTRTPSITHILPSVKYSSKKSKSDKYNDAIDYSESEEITSEDSDGDEYDEEDDNLMVEEEESDEGEIKMKKLNNNEIKDILESTKDAAKYLRNDRQFLSEKADALNSLSSPSKTPARSSPPPTSFSELFQTSSTDVSPNSLSSSLSASSIIPSSSLYFHPTRMDEAVSRVSKEKAKKYLNVESIWSDATKQKHSWVNRLLTIWAEKVEIEPWPLHHEAARGFVLFCGKECHYPLSSIRYVIIPSLKRINIIKRGKRLSSNTYHSLKDAVRCLKYSSEVEKTVTKKEPAVLQDVKRIVHFIPNTMLDKALESSLFLVAVHTGARAITLSSVKLSDIKQVVRSKFTNKLLCTIQFNRTKASHNWGHKVTIEGNEDEENDEDPVYWLSLYVYQKTGIRLSDWNNAKEKANLNQLVWPLSTDSMRERFKSRAEAAGYPRHLFCFHSLRSGFICTALIAANKDNETQRAVMEKTAFVAGWQQCRLSQCTYIKEAVKRAMVASRLITTNDDRNQTVFDETLLELEVFHGVSFKENVKKEKTPMEKFSELVKRRMSEYYGELIVEEAKRERYIRNGSKKLVEENEELMMVAEYRMKEINEKKEEEQRKTDLYSVASTVANMFIQDQLLVQGKTPEEMATMICDMAESCTSKAP